MKNIAIITARSGSKGLKDKNIKKLNDIPLIAYSINAALNSKCFDEVMVSTDSIEYMEIAKKYGASAPFMRTEENSSDNAGSWDVVKEVLCNYRKLEQKFDTICLLQPTSPLRRAIDIQRGYSMMVEKKADAITAVTEVDHSPLWCMELPEDKSLKKYRQRNIGNAPRQNLNTFYRINGALYIRKINYENDDIKIIDENEYAYIMPQERSVDIDTLKDFKYAEFLIENKMIGEYEDE